METFPFTQCAEKFVFLLNGKKVVFQPQIKVSIACGRLRSYYICHLIE